MLKYSSILFVVLSFSYSAQSQEPKRTLGAIQEINDGLSDMYYQTRKAKQHAEQENWRRACYFLGTLDGKLSNMSFARTHFLYPIETSKENVKKIEPSVETISSVALDAEIAFAALNSMCDLNERNSPSYNQVSDKFDTIDKSFKNFLAAWGEIVTLLDDKK